MKLADFISLRGISLDRAAVEIGDVSVSGLRKWLSGDRVPRPDQMRRVHDWSAGSVAPNDFVLHASTPSPPCDEDGAPAASCPVPAPSSAAQETPR